MNTVEEATDCTALLEMATPSLYRGNLFRVLGLPVSATTADVRRQQKRLEMERKLGVTSNGAHGGMLALDPPGTPDETRAALDRLSEPEARLLDEVFWFWPLAADAAEDLALRALERGQAKEATAIWTSGAKQGPATHVAIHNLAVFEHLVALDYEARLTGNGLDTKQRERLGELWARALSRWGQVIESEDFWSALRTRVREMNDARLTTGLVRRIRATLPQALLLINGKIASGAAERRDTDNAHRHIQLIRGATFAASAADQAIREAIAPVRQRIKAAADNAKRAWQKAPQHGNRFARELHAQASPLLGIVDVLLPPNHPSRIALHDMVADAMLEGQVVFVRKTEDWKESVAVLQLACQVAAGDALKHRLPEQIEILRKQSDAGNDWCSAGYWDLATETLARLESIRAQMDGGDLDGAVRQLVEMDAHNGLPPLRRCIAHCLSLKSIRVYNDAQGAFNLDTEVLKVILSRLRAMPEAMISRVLGNPPTPSTPSFMIPPCLCCGSTGYTAWTSFTYKDIPLFMCSNCSYKHNQEITRQKDSLRSQMVHSLELLLLANEVDPGDAGIQRNMKTLKDIARQVECSIPGTRAIKKQLGMQLDRPGILSRLLGIFK